MEETKIAEVERSAKSYLPPVVESLAARAIHVAGTASSGQAAVPVSGTVA